MAKKLYILLLVVIGLLIGPQSAMAHRAEATKVCCKNTSSEMSCCKDKKQAMQKKHDCEGSCKSISCACPTAYVTVSFVTYAADNSPLFDFSETKQNYFYVEISHSNDSRTIWLPPKIS